MAEKTTMTMEQLKEFVASLITEKIEALGLTKVDRRFAVYPTQDQMMGRQGLTPESAEKIVRFFKGLMHPDARYSEVPGVGGPLWRDLSVVSPTGGGYLVPTEFRAEVIVELAKLPVMRNIVRVFPIGAKMDVPAVTTKPGMTWPGENTVAGSTQPAFGTIPLTAKLGLAEVPMSRALFANAGVNIVALLTTLFAEAFAAGEDAVIVNGTGSGQPTGFRTESVTAVVQAGANLAGDDLINLYHALPSQYRRNGTWLVPDTVTAKIRKLKESTTGNYLWVPGLAGAPGMILGRPVVEQNDIPTNLGSGSPATESEIWFGDWQFYYLGENETMGVETTTEGGDAWSKHQVRVKAFEEIDGKLAVTNAVRKLTGVK
jgi:HK97 family phage major capsid protein